MAPPEDVVRLRHILDAAQKAVAFCQGRTRTDLEEDELLALALVRLMEIIGEAAKAVSPKTRSEVPAVPWREIAGTRDRLIHGYADVDLDIIWAVVSKDLPPLIAELKKLVPPETG